MKVEKGFDMQRDGYPQTNAEKDDVFSQFVGQSGAFQSILETIETVCFAQKFCRDYRGNRDRQGNGCASDSRQKLSSQKEICTG